MGISRDEICAQRIGFIAELGGMEEEITVYGCCYLDHGKIKYRVSNQTDDIYRFVLQAIDEDLFPTPIQSLTIRQIIAAGDRDEVLYQAKKKLAKNLQTLYPAEFFTTWQPFVEQRPNNEAWPVVALLQETLEGLFEADELQFYEAIMRQCCQKKLLDEQHQIMGWQWLEKNYKQMEDDVVVKERNERTFYGILYLKADNDYGCKSNLELERVVNEKLILEQQGVLVSPVLQKTFWYKETQQLFHLRNNFEKWMQELAENRLDVILKILAQLPSAVETASYRQLLSKAEYLPRESQFALQWYGHIWNV